MKIKKIKTMLILMLVMVLCLSIVLAKNNHSAENDNSAEIKERRMGKLNDLLEKRAEFADKIKNMSEDRINKLLVLPTGLQRSFLANNMSFDKYSITLLNNTMKFRKRIMDQNKLRMAELNYTMAKQRFVNAKMNYNIAKEKFLMVKLKKNATSDKTKDYLLKTADIMLKMLEKVKSKLEANENIDDLKANEMILQINDEIAEIQKAKSAIEAAQTEQEIKEAAKVIFDAWKFTKPALHRNINRIVNTKIGEIVQRSENLEAKLECVTDLMKEKGIDTTNITNQLSNFSALIVDARNLYEHAFRLSGEGSYNETKQDIKEAHDKLQQAHVVLKEILMEVRNSGINLTSCKQEMFAIEPAGD